MTTNYDTDYGSVTFQEDGSAVIIAHADDLYRWANRPGNFWPCSELAGLDYIIATFTPNGDLVDLEQFPEDGFDITADEFDAWSSDVLVATRDERGKAAIR